MDDLFRTQIRFPSGVYRKIRVLAALRGESINATVVAASQELIEAWESKYGELPTPPEGA